MRFLAFLTVIFISESAFAAPVSSDFFFKPYVGADYDQFHVKYTSGNSGVFSDNVNGGDVHIGARIHKYLGFEASYFDSTKSDDSFVVAGTTIKTTAKTNGETFDVMGYLPVLSSQKLELIATAGVAHTNVKGVATAFGTVTLSDNETKGRLGVGAQYWLSDNLNIRGLVRYQDADFSGTIDNMIISSVGLNWQF